MSEPLAEYETIDHPAHYGGDTPTEPIKVIRTWGLNFSLGNVVKYVVRAGQKPSTDALDDLRKAAFYLADEIAARESSHA